jgi:uncharacterized phage-associated protein
MKRASTPKAILVEHEREKLLNAVVYFLRNTKHCGTTKLCKLLYYLDFLHFRETGRSVTGLRYYAWSYGPVPSDFWRELTRSPGEDLLQVVAISEKERAEDFTEMKPKGRFDGRWFSKRETRIITYLSEHFRDSRADQMVKVAHLRNHPWDRTVKTDGMNAEIDYMLALDDRPGSISRDEALERAEDRNAIRKAFGAVRNGSAR